MKAKLCPSVVFAVAGMAATAIFLLLPSGGLAQAVVFVSLTAASTAALFVKIAGGVLAGRLWRILAISQVLYLVATAVWYVYPVGFGGQLAYPSLVDALFWASYVGWGVFLVLVTRRRSLTDRGAGWDLLAASCALSIVVYVLLLRSAVGVSGLSRAAQVASISYPVLTLTLMVIGVRLVLTRSRLAMADVLLALWVALELAGDLWYSVASVNGTFRYGHPVFATWMLSSTAVGVLALRRDAALLLDACPARSSPRVRATVLWVVLGAALMATASQAVGEHRSQANVMALLLWVAMGVVLGRLAWTSRDLAAEKLMHEKLMRAHGELEFAATHDTLTGVANRACFDAFLAPALARRRTADRCAALMLIDVDAFKAVNDSYGHPTGDALLRLTAQRLVAVARPSDLVARLGGDEFAILIDDIDVRASLELVDRVFAVLQEPAVISGVVIHPRLSLGVSLESVNVSSEAMMLRADTALYAAKIAGGGRNEVYCPTRHRHFLDRRQTEIELRRAVTSGELVLHYQPVFDIASRQVVMAEALLRWNHPTRGFLGAGEFIDVAEASGIIVDIGHWVLEQACRDVHAWQSVTGGSGVGIAVNLSRRQLRSPTVVDGINEVFHSADIDPRLVTFEVTETALMTDTAELVARLDKIGASGAHLALDDFGTGYSSLSQLRALPIDLLKIDKAFVDGIASQDEEWALAAAIIRLAVSLGKRTLAEGIERASQLAHLRSLGCELGQGWLFARDMPLEAFIAFLASHDPGAPRFPR